LIFNMLYLWIFGDNIEDLLGRGWFLFFYLVCGIFAALIHCIFNINSQIPCVGASGAIAGVMGAYIWCFPRNNIRNFYFFFPGIKGVFKIPAWFYLGFWFLGQIFSVLFAGGSPVAFWAHIGGFAMGAFLINGLPKNPAALEYYKDNIRLQEKRGWY